MKDRQVVIIGGSGSIGMATAQLLLSQGAAVTITGRDERRLALAEKNIAGLRTHRCEITSEVDVHGVFSEFHQIDHVVVLAGSANGGPIVDSPPSAQRFIVEERIWGPIHVVRAAFPKMRQGSVTLTSGLFSQRPPRSGVAVLAAALAGTEGLARALARELAPVRVNAISFGVVRSGRHGFMGADQEPYYQRIGAALPSGHIADPGDAAHAILFAMENRYLSGEVLHVDGGARLV